MQVNNFPQVLLGGYSAIWGSGGGETYLDRSFLGAGGVPAGPFGSTPMTDNYWAEDWGTSVSAFMTPVVWFADGDICGDPIFPFGFIAFAVGAAGQGPIDYEGVSAWRHTHIHGGVEHTPLTPFAAFYDYNYKNMMTNPGNPLNPDPRDDLFGQPTQSTMLSRTYAQPYVWDTNLLTFPLASGPMQTTTPGVVAGVGNVAAPQVAMGKGVAYYERKGHSNEPPNLLAPYWRAALTRWTIDRPTIGAPTNYDNDTNAMLVGVSPEYAAEHQGLVTAGYRGFQ